MLEAEGLVKRYPGVTALDGVDLSVRPGEVVALIGENGAGKSTLIKVLGGLVHPDGGRVRLDGQPVRLDSPADATRLGIGLIHQELSDLDNLDVAANIFLGREPRRLGFLIDEDEIRARSVQHLARLGMGISPSTPMRRLSLAERQMVEIAKALSLNARYLVMDEPTSCLTAGETERLLSVARELATAGVGVVYVSHRLNEVQSVADRVVALRDGRNAGELSRAEMNPAAMVRMMVGRDLEPAPHRESLDREARLQVSGLRTRRYPGEEISFDVGAGEIVGIAGLVGAGRTEVVRALFGVEDRVSGKVVLDGRPIPSGDPGEAIRCGLFLAPEDRRAEGLITTMTVRENVSLPSVKRYAKGGLIDRARERAVAERMRDSLRIKSPTTESEVRGLSGGNQQKVVLAKWLSLEPKCMVFDEPTRGIDVGARAEIYALIRRLAEDGVAIVMISSDMEEVLAMSDRVIVMHEGRMAGVLPGREATEESIMRLAVGRV